MAIEDDIAREKAQLEAEKRRLAQAKLDFQDVVTTPVGRRFLSNLIAECGVYSANPDGNQYIEGRRAIGLFLLGQFEQYAPGSYIQLLQEQTNGNN